MTEALTWVVIVGASIVIAPKLLFGYTKETYVLGRRDSEKTERERKTRAC